MKSHSFFISIFITLVLITNCVSIPKSNEFQVNNCELVTKEMELVVLGSDQSWLQASRERANNDIPVICSAGPSDAGGAACVLGGLLYGTVAATSLVVSGSIVIVGNTVHWIEKQGKCDESQIKSFAESITQSLVNSGGWVVTKTEDLYDWINGIFEPEAK